MSCPYLHLYLIYYIVTKSMYFIVLILVLYNFELFNKNLYLIYRHFISKQELYHRFVKSPGYNSPTLSLSLLKIISCNKSFHINKINNQIFTKNKQFSQFNNFILNRLTYPVRVSSVYKQIRRD